MIGITRISRLKMCRSFLTNVLVIESVRDGAGRDADEEEEGGGAE